MRSDLGVILLELTRQSRRFTLDHLAIELRCEPARLLAKLEKFQEDGLLSFNGKELELDGRQRIMLAAQLIHNGRDAARVSRFLEWQEFENFAVNIFEENDFHTTKHLIFKSRARRREVDILAWNDTFMLAVDCKHWLRGLSLARLKDAARAQTERAMALAERPELLFRLGVTNPERRRIMPIIFSLGEPRQSVADGVPIVSVSKFLSFLYGISPVDDRFHMISVSILGMQLPLR